VISGCDFFRKYADTVYIYCKEGPQLLPPTRVWYSELQVAKTACRQKLLPELPLNHNTKQKKQCKKSLPLLPHLYGPFILVAYFSKTMKTPPTKLASDLTHTPINTPIEAIWVILITFYILSTFLHHSKFVAVSIIAVASSSIGGIVTMKLLICWVVLYCWHMDLNCFSLLKKNQTPTHLNRCSNNQ
jgi:hypothetical protein